MHLVKTLREEFKAPLAAATIGFGGWKMEADADTVTAAKARLAARGENGTYPEFKGHVKTAGIRNFWRDVEIPRIFTQA